MRKYAKSLLAVAATVLTALVALSGNGITAAEWIQVVIAAAGACAVFTAPNVPGAKYTKTVLAVVTAVAVFLSSAISDGLTGQEWLQVLVVALGAVGVYAVKNVDENGTNLSETGSLGTV